MVYIIPIVVGERTSGAVARQGSVEVEVDDVVVVVTTTATALLCVFRWLNKESWTAERKVVC